MCGNANQPIWWEFGSSLVAIGREGPLSTLAVRRIAGAALLVWLSINLSGPAATHDGQRQIPWIIFMGLYTL